MNDREIAILKYILDEVYTDTPELQKRLNVSTRTVRYSIKNLRKKLETNGCDLLYNRRNGYYFSKAHQVKVKILIQENDLNVSFIQNHVQRNDFLTGKLLLTNKINVKELSDNYFTAPETISAAVSKKVEMFERHGITLYRNNNNFYLKNNTLTNSSVIFINIYLEKVNKDEYLINSKLKIFFLEHFDYNELMLIKGSIEKSDYYTTDKVKQFRILWYLYFVLKYKTIKINEEINNLKLFYENILTDVEMKGFNEILNCLEVYDNLEIDNEIIKKTNKFMDQYQKVYNLELEFESNEFTKIFNKLHVVKLRYEYGIKIKMYDTDRIIRLYPYSFSITQQLFAYVFEFVSLSRNEIAFVCKNIQRIFFESSSSNVILFINDNADTNFYKEWIIHQYTKNIKIITCNSDDSSIYLNNNNIKLVLNFTNEKIRTKHKMLNIDLIPKISTINKIDNILKSNSSNYELLKNLFNQSLFKVYLNEVSIDDIILNSARSLKKMSYINEVEKFYQQCKKREEISSTYIGYKTAIIHPLKYQSNENVVYLCTSEVGINMDGNTTNIFFICCFKEKIDFNISRFFEILLKIVENQHYNKTIRNAKSELDLILEIERIFQKV